MKKQIKLLIAFYTIIALSTTIGFAQTSWNDAAIFDGTSYIVPPNVPNVNTNMTVEFWIKPKVNNGFHPIIGKDQYRIYIHNGRIRVQVTGSYVAYSNALLNAETWNHVAVTFAGNGKVKIYVNGIYDVQSASNIGAFTNTSDTLYIGKSSIVSNKLIGSLDDLRIWNTNRTSTEISNNYRTSISWFNISSYSQNIVYCMTYDFDVEDYSFYLPYGGGNGNFTKEKIGRHPSNTVMHNGYVYFDGNSNLKANADGDPDVNLSSNMTIETWVKVDAIGTTQTLLDHASFKIKISNLGKIDFFIGGVFGPSGTILIPNQWYHIAIVYKEFQANLQGFYIYINGKQVNSYNSPKLIAGTDRLWIGSTRDANEFFKGYMDELRISNYAKTEQEINRDLHHPIQYHNQPIAPKSTVAYNFDGYLHSGTRLGYHLVNNGCRFAYFHEQAPPMFYMGFGLQYPIMDSMKVNHPNKIIPSTGTAGYTYDTINILKSVNIDPNKVKVFLALTHANTSELEIKLISPFGNEYFLVRQTDSKGKNLTFVLDTQNNFNIGNFNYADPSPLIGCYEKFNSLDGMDSKGDWILKITDLSNGNTGFLFSWGLSLEGSPATGMETSITNQNKLIIYPTLNEGNGINIKFSKAITHNVNISVYNMLGQQMLNQTLNMEALEMYYPFNTNLPSGQYFIKIETQNELFTQKFIVK